MIEQAKEVLQEAERQGAVGIMVRVDVLKYLIGEVERLHEENIILLCSNSVDANNNVELRSEVKKLQEGFQQVNADYKALTDIMDRARKLAFMASEEVEEKPIFKMVDGCLTRIEY